MKDIVRILEIELNNFKNVKNGVIQMPSEQEEKYFEYSSDIVGIYGQNGSGKTAVIQAMAFIQRLLMGESLPANFADYINKQENECGIRVKFSIESAGKKAVCEYEIKIEKEDLNIKEEILSAAIWNGEKFSKKKNMLKYNRYDEKHEITPILRYDSLIKANRDNKVNLTVAKRISEKDKCSFLFGNEGKKIFIEGTVNEEYSFIIKSLAEYAKMSLFVVESGHSAAISMSLFVPFSFRGEYDKGTAKGELPIRIDKPSVISEFEYELAERFIAEMNIVLCTLVPELSIQMKNHGKQLLENGEDGYRIELLSERGDVIIPLAYESEGIIKIVSVLNVLMRVYSNPGVCFFIDEFDSGIFEFLLGELLTVLEKGAKGQFVFTSHNLRALEMISKNSLVFSTTNPHNRYIRLQNVKTNNNLRDMYLRTINLGGQEEEVYAMTDTVEIGRAFRRAGRIEKYGEEN